MNDEILVPLDLSDAIAMIDRQKQQIMEKEGEYKKLLLHYNAVTKELTELIAGPIRLCVNYTDDFSSVEIGVCDENGDEMDREVIADAVLRIITKLTTENKHLRVRLRTHGGIETDKEEALRGEEESKDGK